MNSPDGRRMMRMMRMMEDDDEGVSRSVFD